MSDEELKAACEAAGLRCFPSAIGDGVNTGFSVELIENPMLPSYVADLLVAKVWATRWHKNSDLIDRYLDSVDTTDCGEFFATAEQRITAAMRALKEAGE